MMPACPDEMQALERGDDRERQPQQERADGESEAEAVQHHHVTFPAVTQPWNLHGLSGATSQLIEGLIVMSSMVEPSFDQTAPFGNSDGGIQLTMMPCPFGQTGQVK
jgi:hypothetical protein